MAWQPPAIDFWSIPRCWPGETVAILGGGASLTQEQADYCRGKCRIIAINRAGVPKPRGHQGRWVYAPYADWLWACDADRFWLWHPEAAEFPGIKIVLRGISPSREYWRRLEALSRAGVKVIRHSGLKHPIAMGRHEGASSDPAVVHGNNSAFQILSVIKHTGASTVLLLGIDMKGNHFHGGYHNYGAPEYATNIIPNFATLVSPLAKAGVVVLNASPGSALQCWPPVRLESVL